MFAESVKTNAILMRYVLAFYGNILNGKGGICSQVSSNIKRKILYT